MNSPEKKEILAERVERAGGLDQPAEAGAEVPTAAPAAREWQEQERDAQLRKHWEIVDKCGIWWNRDDLSVPARLLRHKGMRLAQYLTSLVGSPWWKTLDLAQRGEILTLITSTADPDALQVPFGVIVGIAAERRAELRARYGGLFVDFEGGPEDKADFRAATGVDPESALYLNHEPGYLLPSAGVPADQAN